MVAARAKGLRKRFEEEARKRMQERKGGQPGASRADGPTLSKQRARDDLAKPFGALGRSVQKAENRLP